MISSALKLIPLEYDTGSILVRRLRSFIVHNENSINFLQFPAEKSEPKYQLVSQIIDGKSIEMQLI